MSIRGRGFGRAGITALLALAADQSSKALVRSSIEPGEVVSLPAGIDLVRVANEGIAFGLLSDAPGALIVLGAAAFTVVLGLFLAQSELPGAWLPVGLVAGGALGNLVDRISRGAVTDFIDLSWWPTFNVADVLITAGVVVLIVLIVHDERRDAGEG
jgi:signal peptidase II